jgi:hypothetical protein
MASLMLNVLRSSQRPGVNHLLPTLLKGTCSVFNPVRRLLSSELRKEHIVVALGGNALLKRGEEMTGANQRQNIADGVESLKNILKEYRITLVHGNGPQVGLLVRPVPIDSGKH